MHEVVMPAMGMAMSEGTLLRWLKQPGDAVRAGEEIAEIETDKATAELESPAAGVLGALLVAEGETVPTGALLTRVLAAGEQENGSANGAGGGDGAEALASAASAPARPAPAAASPVPAAAAAGSAPTAAGEPPSAAAREREPRPATRRPTVTVVEAPPRDPDASPWSEPRRGGRGRRRYEVAGANLERPADDDELLALELGSHDHGTVAAWLETMALIRVFEERAAPLARAGKMPGGMHSAAGQEAVAVGAVRALRPTDIVTSSHRSHHHALAKGLRPDAIMAELYGKAGGCLGGRAGHMHLADFSIGLFGSNGIVGAGLGIATGAAVGAKLRGRDQVAVGFFGDGGASTGRTWENVNLAAMWALPLIAICENNLYAVETHLTAVVSDTTIADRAAGFGLHVVQVDGQDVIAVHDVVAEARERALRGGGPTFVEARTYRYSGHTVDDPETYREADEVERWRRTRDPLERAARALEAAGALEGGLDAVLARAEATVAAAVEFAESSPWPDPATAAEGVYGIEVNLEGKP
jgi:TPP-dependent pyruvate/acetoin dehydrogenase alpha subunit